MGETLPEGACPCRSALVNMLVAGRFAGLGVGRSGGFTCLILVSSES
jgi:hypothetical protein